MTNTALLTWEKVTLQLRNPFRLSYGVSETRQAFLIHLAGNAGWGEGTIPPYYGVDQDAMTGRVGRVDRAVGRRLHQLANRGIRQVEQRAGPGKIVVRNDALAGIHQL